MNVCACSHELLLLIYTYNMCGTFYTVTILYWNAIWRQNCKMATKSCNNINNSCKIEVEIAFSWS